MVCTTLEKSCFACYCSIAEEEFSGFTYCKTFWAKYLIQVINNTTAVCRNKMWSLHMTEYSVTVANYHVMLVLSAFA